MKKFLSLVLALVMTMSLVTISAGAKDFTDADAINYDEAIAVMSAVKVIDGYTDGSFKPATQLNRGQAAKIICNLVLGPTTAAELPTSVAPFKDVAADNTFAGYIAYCAKEGIVGGYADGTFKPTAPLTGYAFMKMLLGALGYDAEIEGYNDPKNWSIAVAKQALGIGLTAGLKEDFNGVKYVTREEACLYAFNTLKATMVDYDTKTTVNVGDASVTIAGSTAKPVSYANSNVQTGISHDGNIKDDGFVQFAEQYFPKLTRKDDTDPFMRPANTWVYDKTDVGTYVDYTKLVETYKKGVTGKDIYDLLKSATIRDSILECYVDGAENNNIKKTDLVRSNNDDLKGTGTGVLTEVYLEKDADGDISWLTIVSVNTYLAKASADYSEKKEYAPIKAYTAAAPVAYNVDVEDVAAVKDVEKDGFYLVTISYKDVTGGEVKSIVPAEVLTDSTITKFSASKDGNGTGKVSKVTTGGEEYKANEKAFYEKDTLDQYNLSALTDATYNVYLDTYGNFIGVDLFQGTKKYVFITGYDRPTSNLAVKTADAAAIFLDGTMDVIKVNVTDTNKNIANVAHTDNYGYFSAWTAGAGNEKLNQWYTYTVNESGVYTLKPCTRMTKTVYTTAYTIDTANVYVNANQGGYSNRVYGEDDSIFLTVDYGAVGTGAERAITEVTGVYTGVQSVDLEIEVNGPTGDPTTAQTLNQVATVYDSDNYIIAAIVIGEAKGSVSNYAYILSKAKSEEKIGDTYYWTFEAIQNGEVKTLTAKSKYANTIDALTENTVQELRFDGDYVTSIKNVNATKIYKNFTVATNGEDVYQMAATGANDTADKLTLSGRTLYVTANRTDVGLALTTDAKAVVIQKENGKSGVKTEFTSVADALTRLADPNNDPSDGLQYSGKIYAALNNKGQATWVVFISNTELKTGAANAYTVGVTLDGSAYTYGAGANKAEVYFGDSSSSLTVAKGEAVYFGVAPNAGNVVTSVKVNGINVYPVDDYAGMDIYYIAKVAANSTIAVTTAPIPAETMTVLVNYEVGGTVIDTAVKSGVTAIAGTTYAQVTGTAPAGYKIVGTATKNIPFVADGTAEVTFTVALGTAAPVTGVTVNSADVESTDGGATSATVIRATVNSTVSAGSLKNFASGVDHVECIWEGAGSPITIANGSTTTIAAIRATYPTAIFMLYNSSNELIAYVVPTVAP